MFDKLKRRNALMIMQRTENKQQGRPTYSGTGKKKRTCPGLTLFAAGFASQAYAVLEATRWLS